jgi:hypothetical protein
MKFSSLLNDASQQQHNVIVRAPPLPFLDEFLPRLSRNRKWSNCQGAPEYTLPNHGNTGPTSSRADFTS